MKGAAAAVVARGSTIIPVKAEEAQTKGNDPTKSEDKINYDNPEKTERLKRLRMNP
jgi:hypothetical protein